MIGLKWSAAGVLNLVFIISMVSAVQADASERHGDWGLSCSVSGECDLSQSVMAPDRSWLATVLLRPLNHGEQARAQVFVPVGVHLASGLYFVMPGQEPISAQWVRCLPENCRAEVNLSAQQLTAWKRGDHAEMRYRTRVDGPVIAFDLSLKGITAALDAAEEAR